MANKGFPGGSDGKESACNVGDQSSIPGSGRSPGEGNGNPLQYSCLENPMDGGAWWATVLGVTKSRTEQLHSSLMGYVPKLFHTFSSLLSLTLPSQMMALLSYFIHTVLPRVPLAL